MLTSLKPVSKTNQAHAFLKQKSLLAPTAINPSQRLGRVVQIGTCYVYQEEKGIKKTQIFMFDTEHALHRFLKKRKKN